MAIKKGKIVPRLASLAAVPFMVLQGCASTPPATPTAASLAHLNAADALECRIESVLYQDLGRLRDAGQPSDAAQNRVYTKYEALANSVDERTAIDNALSHRAEFAAFVYDHPTLPPETLRETGSAICAIHASGGRDPARAAALGNAAVACQNNYSSGTLSAESALKTCIANEATKLSAP
jgi:hypothetical protein